MVNHENNIGPVSLPVSAKRLWKEIILVVLGLSLFVSTFLVPYQSFLPAWRYYDNMYAINPGGSSSFSIDPSLGSNVQLMLVISGEGGLHLSAKNGENRIVIDQILASGSYSFGIPSESGTYSVSLENGGSYVQSIYWIVRMYYYNTIFQLVGISFSSLAFFMFLAHREDKEEEEEIQIPVVPEVKEDAEEDKKSPSPTDVIQQAKKFLEDSGD
jgi:hypothetical protein